MWIVNAAGNLGVMKMREGFNEHHQSIMAINHCSGISCPRRGKEEVHEGKCITK